MNNPTPPTETRRQLISDEAVLAFLMILSLIGIFITDFSTSDSAWYWLVMVPVFAITCLVTEWHRARAAGLSWSRLLWTQILHWGALLVAMYMVFELLGRVGAAGRVNIGVVLVVMLALTTFQAGVYIGWRYCVVGVVLLLEAVFAAYFQAYLWLVLLLAALAVAGSLAWARYGPRRG